MHPIMYDGRGPILPRNTSSSLRWAFSYALRKGGPFHPRTHHSLGKVVRWPMVYVWWLEVLQGPVPKQYLSSFFHGFIHQASHTSSSIHSRLNQCLLLGGSAGGSVAWNRPASVSVSISKKSNWIFFGTSSRTGTETRNFWELVSKLGSQFYLCWEPKPNLW